ncbi:MAG: sugar phosphate isomerase/epimerase family protein [Pleomorphochaeta sp.]
MNNKIGVHYAFMGQEWDVDMSQRLKWAASLGFDNLEVTPPEYMVEMNKSKMKDLKKEADDLGMDLSFCIGFPKSKDMSSLDSNIRSAGIEWSKKMLEAVHYMGGKVLSGILYSSWPYLYDHMITPQDKKEFWDRGVKSVKEVVKVAEDFDILYAVELVNRFEQFIVNSVDEGIQFAKEVDSPNIKLLVDVFHANIEEDSIPDAIRKANDLLVHMHISENNRKLPGTGQNIPWKEIAQATKDINYSGRYVIESFVAQGGPVGNDLRIWRDLNNDVSPAARTRDMKKSLDFVRKIFN